MPRDNACTHPNGDHVAPLMGWVCGCCFKILEDRPKRYGLVPISETDCEGSVPRKRRQEVVWQSAVLVSKEQTTLSIFLAAIANRLKEKGGLDIAAAYDAALDILKGIEKPFGDSGEDWSEETANELADEDMSYWEPETAAEN